MDDRVGNANRGDLDPGGALWKRVLLVLCSVLGLALLLGAASGAVRNVARVVIGSGLAGAGELPQEGMACSSQDTAGLPREASETENARSEPAHCRAPSGS